MRDIYIHRDSFAVAPEINYSDGRHLADAAIRKAHRRGPQRPDSLTKRAKPDAVINAEAAKLLTKRARALRSNAPEALNAIKKIQRSGRRPGFPEHEAQGNPPFGSKSVTAVRKARADAVHVDGHRMLSCNELNKAFADSVGKIEVDLDSVTPHRNRGYATGFYEMSKLEKRAFRKGLGRPPESDNALSGGRIAATGATNDWRDQSAPSVRPTLVGGQPIGTPSGSNRDAALEAIKRALRKPQHALTADEDEDEDEDEDGNLADDDNDDDEDEAKDPNAADAFDTNPNKKRKRRADEDGE